jgi:serine/threonine protein kinase
MIYDDRIIDLLMRREELRQQGADPTVDELCADCPEVREQLVEAIEKIERFNEFVRPIMEPEEDTPSPWPKPPNESGTPPINGARFQFLRPHRTGGLGEVSIAYDGKLDREVALKHIRKTLADDVDSCRRFLREARITGRLEHPGIVPVYDLMGDADGPLSYAMRLVQGETLKEAIERFHREIDEEPRNTPNTRKESRLIPLFFRVFGVFRGFSLDAPPQSSLAFRQLLNRFVTVCQTIAYAHSRGVIHRDLKPANAILGKYGETIVVDWGLAKSVEDEEENRRGEKNESTPEEAPVVLVGESAATKEGQVVGTPQYMSPEQAAGGLVGPASDIYSLGATLYCLLTGTTPFDDPHEGRLQDVLEKVRNGRFAGPRQVRRKITPALEAICLKAMALRPEDRYASAGALADDLEHWLADEPVAAYREP